MNCADAVRLLESYVDSELPVEEARAVAAHLVNCVLCSDRLAERQALSKALRRVPYYSAPPELRAKVFDVSRQSSRVHRFAFAATAVMILAAGILPAARLVGTSRATTAITQGVVEDHLRALRASEIVDVRSSDRHTVKPWFLGKLDFAPPVEDLTTDGFPLSGGRLAHIGGRTVAALVYQRRLHPITVFIWPDTDVRTASDGVRTFRGFHVRHWTANGMSFWAVTDANTVDLDELAKALSRRRES